MEEDNTKEDADRGSPRAVAAAAAIVKVLKSFIPEQEVADDPFLKKIFAELEEEAAKGDVPRLLAKLNIMNEVIDKETKEMEQTVFSKLMTLGRCDGSVEEPGGPDS